MTSSRSLAPCADCGSRSVQAVLRAGVTVHECGLCGALVGENDAVARVRSFQEARQRGVDPQVYPLVLALEALLGIKVVRSHGGDRDPPTLPFVQWGLTGPAALVQVENLTKSLVLARGALRVPWAVEVEYQHRLVFTLKPRVSVAGMAPGTAADLTVDLATLADLVQRNRRLSWWHHPPG